MDEQGHTASTPEGGMLLEPLCDVTWTYDLIRSVEPSPRGDGRLFGQGTAAFTGRLAGHAIHFYTRYDKWRKWWSRRWSRTT